MSLGDNRARALFEHIRALERLQEAIDDARGDYNERKAIVKEDGFDNNVVAAILKRRKNGEGQTMAFDEMLRDYEEAIEEQRKLPLEQRVENEMRDRGFDVSVELRRPERADDDDGGTRI